MAAISVNPYTCSVGTVIFARLNINLLQESPNVNIMIYSEAGVRHTVRLVVPCIFCTLLLGPIVIMTYFHDVGPKLGVLGVFVMGVSGIIAWLTKARDWEILTITAA